MIISSLLLIAYAVVSLTVILRLNAFLRTNEDLAKLFEPSERLGKSS
jgi:hypothetical protein